MRLRRFSLVGCIAMTALLGSCGGSSTPAAPRPPRAAVTSDAPSTTSTRAPSVSPSASPAALTVTAACHILLPASNALTDKLLAAPAGEQRHKVALTFSDLMKKTAARVPDKTFKARAAQLVYSYEHSVGSLPSPAWTESCFAVGVYK